MSQQGLTAVFILCFVSLSLGEERPTVEISLGKIRGHYQQSYGDRKFAAFEGIPYAKPPIGHLRFEAPVEAEPWIGIWDANIVHTCLQSAWGIAPIMGSEDCLYLNVYVPDEKLDKNSNLDVIAHIHGGGFIMGNTNIARPGHLMDRDVVYVSMNYRLGALGFLSTEDHVVPGNMGLKDQVMALRWIQKHIKSFGGNPNSVTIAGVSAGAASVHFHYLSPLSKGLFHRGISQGGTALAPWAFHRAPLKETKRLFATAGCDDPSIKTSISCLKGRSARQIIENSYHSKTEKYPITVFAPVIENKLLGAFITDDPYKLLKSGNITNVPWITGATSEEGILGLMVLDFQYENLNERWDTALPDILSYQHTVAESDKASVAHTIKKFYFDDSQVSEDNIQPLIKLFSDRFFHVGLETSARLQAKVSKSPVYSYIYGYKMEKEDEKFDELFGLKYGVGHGCDAFLLYTIQFDGIIFPEGKIPKADERIKEHLVDFVTSFAKHGKPISNGISWESVVDSDKFRYLLIHNDEVKTVSKNELAPVEFWQSLPLKEYDNIVMVPSKDEL